MLKRLLETDRNDLAGFVARVFLGIVMFPHGAQKMLGWFGGHGFSATMGFFGSMGIPPVFAFLAIFAEFFGALGVIFGFLTRVAAFGIGMVMLVAMTAVHLPNGFFAQQNGIEFTLILFGVGLAVMIKGAGRWSLDELLMRVLSNRTQG
ncbi:MAG TPA: DoxX family protein [Candidatus Latescibacteria bacterium]|nr:DoxX family protein [Candidatus Latescibacterota bacterium]